MNFLFELSYKKALLKLVQHPYSLSNGRVGRSLLRYLQSSLLVVLRVTSFF